MISTSKFKIWELSKLARPPIAKTKANKQKPNLRVAIMLGIPMATNDSEAKLRQVVT